MSKLAAGQLCFAYRSVAPEMPPCFSIKNIKSIKSINSINSTKHTKSIRSIKSISSTHRTHSTHSTELCLPWSMSRLALGPWADS